MEETLLIVVYRYAQQELCDTKSFIDQKKCSRMHIQQVRETCHVPDVSVSLDEPFKPEYSKDLLY